MPSKEVINSPQGFQSPLLSQAIKYGDTIYVSGNIGIDTKANEIVQGSVGDRTRQALLNMQVVLEAAGCTLQNLLKVNIFLTNMQDYAAMNKVYTEMVPDPKPARTCVAVYQLPFGTDVEIEGIAHLGQAVASKL